MHKDILVTGDSGFVGRHAMRLIPGARGLEGTAGFVDLRDKEALIQRLGREAPEAVIHLAGMSFVPDSFQNPEGAYGINFLGTLRLMEALAEIGFTGRFLYVSSGDAYGAVAPEHLPVPETLLLRPRSPYAVSKAAAEALCYQWSQCGPFEVIVARPFNHLGAGQAPTFAISDFARQIAEIAAGRRAPQLIVGNVEVTRDFTDVQDVVHAYQLLLGTGHNGEVYNVCSGQERTLRDLLERMLALSGVEAEICVDPARVRPNEQLRMCGNHAKLSAHTGWQPSVPIGQTLTNLYRFWQEEIGR